MSRAKLFQIAGPATHRLHPDHHPTYHHPPTPHSVRTNPHPSIVVTRDYLPSPAYSSHPNHPQQPSATMSRVISNKEQVWPLIHFIMFALCKKSSILESKSMTNHQRSFHQLPPLGLRRLRSCLS